MLGKWRRPHAIYRVRPKSAFDQPSADLSTVDAVQGEILFSTGHHVVETRWPQPKRDRPAALKYSAVALAALISSQQGEPDALPLLFLSWRSRQLVFSDVWAQAQLEGAVFEVDLGAEMSADMEWSEPLLTLAYARALKKAERLEEAEDILGHLREPELAILSYCEIYEARRQWHKLEEITRAIGTLGKELDPPLLAFRANAFYHLDDPLSGLEAFQLISETSPRFARHKASADYARLCESRDNFAEAERARAYVRFENPNCHNLRARDESLPLSEGGEESQ